MTNITYRQYLTALAAVQLDAHKVVALSLPPKLMALVGSLKAQFDEICEAARIGMKDIVRVLSNKDAYTFMRMIGYNLKVLVKGLHTLTSLLPRGLTALFQELQDTKVLQAIRTGALTVDAFLDKYPIVKKVAGPVLAALLFWMWTQAAFVGDPWTDFDLSDIGAALLGHFSFHDLFTTPEGLAGLALFAAGLLTPGIGISWLGSNAANTMLAFIFTMARKVMPTVAQHLKQVIPKSSVLRTSFYD